MSAGLTPAPGTWDQFEDQFQPIPLDDGSLIRDLVTEKVDHHYWWTVLDCDGELYLSPGFHVVNRFGNVKCRLPWSDHQYAMPDYLYE